MSAAIMSQDPFSDSNIEPVVLSETDFIDFMVIDGDDSTLADELYTKTASRPDKVAVPILEPLPPNLTWSPQSSASTTSSASTAPTSIASSTCNNPIQWNNADLMYLLSCILPEDLTANLLVFSPPLEHLRTSTYPIHIQLFKKLPVFHPPPEAYSKYAPIGTGRPCSKLLLAESDRNCSNPTFARRSLARDLLSDTRAVGAVVDRYNVLVALHSLPTITLYSVQHCLFLMSTVSDTEWTQRLDQLRGIVDGCYAGESVDGTCAVEARLEIFFLEVGREEMEGWMRTVGVAMGLAERERKVWAEVYGDAAAFVRRAVWELFG